MKSHSDCCSILGVAVTATPEQIKQAYKDLVRVWHPDRFAHDPNLQLRAEIKLKEINQAYEHLQLLMAENQTSSTTYRQSQADAAGQDHDNQRPLSKTSYPTETTSQRPGGFNKLTGRRFFFSPSTTRGIIWALGGVFAGYLVWWGVPAFVNRNEVPGSIEHMQREAAQLNGSLPALLDKETELTIAEGAYRMLIYKYRLINVSAGQVDYRKFAADNQPKLVQASCTNPATRNDFLIKGISLRYSYFDKDKRHLATIDVTPKDCGL